MEQLLGIIAGVFTTLAVLPQVYKAVRTKSVGDVSLWMFLSLLLGVGAWTLYGILKNDWAIIITNGLSFIFNSIMIYIKTTYTSKK